MTARDRHQGLKRFGEALRQYRRERNASLTEVVKEARRLAPGLPLSTSSLSRLELGEGRAPDAELLEALSRVYKVPYETIVQVFVRDAYGIEWERGTHLPEDLVDAEPKN